MSSWTRQPAYYQFQREPGPGSGWIDHRDYHIRGDWVLIYRLNETPQGEEVIFVRTGTHAEVFE